CRRNGFNWIVAHRLSLVFLLSWLARRRFGWSFARQRYEIVDIAHRPLADAESAAALGQIDVHVTLVKAVGGRPKYRGEARAGTRLQPLARRFRDRHVGQFESSAVGQRQRADVERIALAVFADLRADD